MRSVFASLACAGVAALFLCGCASNHGPTGPEIKLGRGMNNFTELWRGGEMRRSVEQTSLFRGAEIGRTAGVIHGFNRSVARTFVGAYEIFTAPIPNRPGRDYGPIFYPEKPVYPDSYKPGITDDPIFATDTFIGYSGGESAPFMPNSRFKIFPK